MYRNTVVLLVLMLGCVQYTGGQCTFPSDISNSVWTSSEFGDITFGSDSAEFEDDGVSYNWTCVVSSGNNYVIRTVNSFPSASLGTNIYYYYCFNFNQQGTDSYLYYHPTELSGNKRRKLLDSTTTTVSAVCSEAIDTAEYHVMVKKNTASTVKNYCSSPLLGDFHYACPTGSGNGTVNVCDAYSQQTLAFNHSQCTPSSPVLFSSDGVLNCIAKTSTTVSSSTVYYQTLYNTDANPNGLSTFQFVCLAITEASDGTVSFSYRPTSCTAGQTSTTNSNPIVTFSSLTSTTLCPITESSSSGPNIALIVGLVVGIVVLLIIAGILIFYFCYYKRDPNAGKPIVENTKPRFEDPDKDDIIEDLELVDTSSTPVTRDEITFEAMSPNILTNGKWPNGNAVSRSPNGFIPSGLTNGSARRDSGIDMSERSSERPIPRIGLNAAKESMVIFNGDEKVISGNDTRIVPNENPNARTLQMNNSMAGEGQLTLHGLDLEEEDELGELTQRESMPYPSLPREKSNLLPPIETADPENDKAEN